MKRTMMTAAALALAWPGCGSGANDAPSPATGAPPGSAVSGLWGQSGERWTPASRLPDLSYAGYQRGEQAIPSPAVTANVRGFGACGDGVADDTPAFQAAIRATAAGAILVPAGRYPITDFLTIDEPNLVLRGEAAIAPSCTSQARSPT